MEGKVELTIDRYEELTALERNLKAREKELDELKRIATDEGNVLTYKRMWQDSCGNVYSNPWEYKGKDHVLVELVENLKSCDKEKRRLEQDLDEYKYACFSDRLCYLFLRRLPHRRWMYSNRR